MHLVVIDSIDETFCHHRQRMDSMIDFPNDFAIIITGNGDLAHSPVNTNFQQTKMEDTQIANDKTINNWRGLSMIYFSISNEKFLDD